MGWDPFSKRTGIFIFDLKLSRRERKMKNSSRATSRISGEFILDVSEAVSLSLSSGVDVINVVFAPCRRQAEKERIGSCGRSG
jgi:hypothetical protein